MEHLMVSIISDESRVSIFLNEVRVVRKKIKKQMKWWIIALIIFLCYVLISTQANHAADDGIIDRFTNRIVQLSASFILLISSPLLNHFRNKEKDKGQDKK